MQHYEVANHEPSLLPEGKRFRLVWSDEFDGDTLDRTKWDYRTAMMGKVHPAWTDDGVTLDGSSNAVFTLQLKDGMPVSSQLQTGYNFMDEPIKKTKFGCDDLQWNIGKLKKAFSPTNTAIMNAAAACSKSPAGGVLSGCSPPSSALPTTRRTRALR